MRRDPLSVETGVRAFRELTAAPADGAATRARVLALAERRAARRTLLRRAAPLAAALLLATSSGAGAWTAASHWRAEAPRTIETAGPLVAKPLRAGPVLGGSRRPDRVIPPLLAEASPLDDTAASEVEQRDYARAHRAHFVDGAPAAALAAWDAYLATHPEGTFAPEARYNRALCLARLGRFAGAARALRPFADGRYGAYRRQDAALLLDWLGRATAR